jgi:hypothetical protein
VTGLCNHKDQALWYGVCYGSTWAGSQRGFSDGSRTVVLDRTRNVLSYVSTYSVSGDRVQTRGTCVKSTGKGATEIEDLW